MDSSAKDREEIYEDFKKYSKQNLVAWELYLHIISSLDKEENLHYLEDAENDGHFRIDQSNDIRGLYLVFAMNKHRSLATKKGREFLSQALKKLAKVNVYNTLNVLKQLSKINKMKPEIAKEVRMMIEGLKSSVEENSSVYNNCNRILEANK